MENETEIIEIKEKNMYAQICIAQTICIGVIIIAVIIIKLFFSKSFLQLKSWCENNLFEHTSITAQFDEDQSSEI